MADGRGEADSLLTAARTVMADARAESDARTRSAVETAALTEVRTAVADILADSTYRPVGALAEQRDRILRRLTDLAAVLSTAPEPAPAQGLAHPAPAAAPPAAARTEARGRGPYAQAYGPRPLK